MFKPARIALAAVLVVVGICVGTAYAATTNAATTNASCTPSPTVTDTGTGQRITVVCTIPKPPAVTVTSTATATVTATVTATPSPSGSATATPTPSPTPTPTPTPTASPSPPAVGFPDASNTGVPAGTTLTAYTGGCTITAPVTFDAQTVNCPGGLVVQAAGVVIRNSSVNGRIVVDTDISQAWSLTLTDSEVNGGKGDWPTVGNGNVTILRANLHGGHNGLQCEEHSSVCSIRDSWVHDQYQPTTGDSHLGGIADFGHAVACKGIDAGGVPACIEVSHNTIACDAPVNSSGGGCTGDLNMLTQYGPLHGAVVKDNLFVANIGASYCTYGGRGTYPNDHVIYTGNLFQRGTNRICGAYGPVTNFDSNVPSNVWSNNVWTDGGPVIPEN